MLEIRDLTVAFGDVTIVDDISFNADDGEWVMVVGPNGAGKSTIVSAIAQVVPYTGSVLLDGHDLKTLKTVELAKKVGILMQQHSVSYSFTVEEVVRLGRYAYAPHALGTTSDEDEAHIDRAIEACGIGELVDHSVLTLSGGELQRVFLAQLFAQDPQMLILDEPTNHLDLIYQKQVFELVRHWVEDTGRSVISIVHDLSLARMFGTRALLLKDGHIHARGSVDEVMTRGNLREVFGMDVYEWMSTMYAQWAEPIDE